MIRSGYSWLTQAENLPLPAFIRRVNQALNGLTHDLQSPFAVLDKGGAVFNVKAYGAKGDGITDDTAAIQAACNAVTTGSGYSTARGGVVLLPPGVFKITAPVQVHAGTVVVCAGKGGTILKNASGTTDAIQAKQVESGSGRDITIRDLTIVGVNGATAGSAINLDDGLAGGSSFHIENVAIYWGYNGVRTKDAVVGYIGNVRVNFAAGDGFVAEGSTNAVVWQACYAVSGAGYGYRLLAPVYSALIGCACDSNTLGGYYFQASGGSWAYNLTMVSCGAEYNGGNGVWFENGAYVTLNSVQVVADIAHGGVDGIRLDSTGPVILENCHVGAGTGWGLRNTTVTNATMIGGYIGGGSLGAVSDPTTLVKFNVAGDGALTMGGGTVGSLLRVRGTTLPQASVEYDGANYWKLQVASNGLVTHTAVGAGALHKFANAVQLASLGAFATGDKYLIVDASGNVHVSALGPAS